MGPQGQVVHNQRDLLGDIGAPDWAAMAAASRRNRRNEFEQASLYESGGGSRIQELSDPSYRAGDLPGSELRPIGVQGPSLPMSDPFISQASQFAGMQCSDGFDCCFSTFCSSCCVAVVQQT